MKPGGFRSVELVADVDALAALARVESIATAFLGERGFEVEGLGRDWAHWTRGGFSNVIRAYAFRGLGVEGVSLYSQGDIPEVVVDDLAETVLSQTGWRRLTALEAKKIEDWERWWEQTGARELRHLLTKDWHPSGGRDEPQAADKYKLYEDRVVVLLRDAASAEVIADFLTQVEEHRTGVAASATTRERNQALASRLRAWYDKSTADAR